MSTVPALLKQRWKSRKLVGEAAHACLVRIEQGWMNHFYDSVQMLDTSPNKNPRFPIIWQGNNQNPWQGHWTAEGGWITLPNLQSVDFTRSLADSGGSVLTVVMDNIAFNQAVGTAGNYHTIDRGWYSPTRGVKTVGRARLWPANAWADVLNAGYRIEVWEGYGIGADIIPVRNDANLHWSAPGMSRTWIGWLDEVDMESHPDHVTLTCRDGSILLTDQRLMGQNKAAELQSPITFADRKTTLADPKKAAKAKGWILCDDAADVVRMILLWAGFKEFDVRNFGWTLEQPMQFGQDAFMIDAINQIKQQGNYLFFIDAPTDHGLSLGVPRFVPQTATDPPPRNMLKVQDTQLAEALTVKWDRSNLPYVMRYRGAQSKTGTTLFADTVLRYTGTYWPPWSGHDYTNLQGHNFKGGYPLERLGGIRRQFSQTNPALTSVAQCLFACILAAIQYALQAVTGTLQIPGLPGVSPNQQVSVIDQGTGTTSRMWVASVESRHTMGPNGNWHMVVGGSMLDTEDMNLIAQDYKYTYQRYVAERTTGG